MYLVHCLSGFDDLNVFGCGKFLPFLIELLYGSLRPFGVRFNGERSVPYADPVKRALVSRKADLLFHDGIGCRIELR